MPINVYTGLMRSGKSYEVVSEVILAAILSGRRVVTNVDGISNDLIREYVAQKNKCDIEKLGTVVHVVNADVFRPDFFPFYDDEKSVHTDTIVQPGDLVCIDEAWRFWGGDCKILKEHKSFFLEHGHFTNEKTGVACDLVLMIQDMGTLNRFVKNVVAFNFRTHKKVSLGMGNTYSITCWEGFKQTKQTRIGEWIRRYSKEIFPLYSSFKGGVQGKTVNVDSRQNIFSSKKLLLGVILFLIFGIWSVRTVYKFFKPDPKTPVVAASGAAAPGAPGSVAASAVAHSAFSENWRIAGVAVISGKNFVVVTNSVGSIRLESPPGFSNSGFVQVGEIDGQKVSVWSGSVALRSSSNAFNPTPAPALAPAVVQAQK